MIIYLCAFIHPRYIEQAKICIRSIREKGQFTGKIYLFTDQEVSIENVDIIKTNIESRELSASFRLRIFEYISLQTIPTNEVLLYLDTDIVIINKIPSFNDINHKIHLYGYPSKTQISHSGAGFITIDSHYTSKTEICSGILLFKPSTLVKKVFDEAYSLYNFLLSDNIINEYWEQPALSYIMTAYDMDEVSLNRFVHEIGDDTMINKDTIFIHYCGIRNSSLCKMMKNMLEENVV